MLLDCDACNDEFELEELSCPRCVRQRNKLPKRRENVTHTLVVKTDTNELKLFVTIGFYADGRLGEVFIDVAKEGSLLRDAFQAWAIALSQGFQRGLRASDLLGSFKHLTSTPGVMYCEGTLAGTLVASPFDAVARLLEKEER